MHALPSPIKLLGTALMLRIFLDWFFKTSIIFSSMLHLHSPPYVILSCKQGWKNSLVFYPQIDSDDLFSPYHQAELEDDQPILYPLHYGVAVKEATYADTIPDHIVQRRMHVQMLHEKSGRWVVKTHRLKVSAFRQNIVGRRAIIISGQWTRCELEQYVGRHLWSHFEAEFEASANALLLFFSSRSMTVPTKTIEAGTGTYFGFKLASKMAAK